MKFVFADPKEVEEAVMALGCPRNSMALQSIQRLHDNLKHSLDNYMARLVDYKTCVKKVELADKDAAVRNCQDGVHFNGKPPRCYACGFCRLHLYDFVVFARNNLQDLAEELADRHADIIIDSKYQSIHRALSGVNPYPAGSPHDPYEERWELYDQ